MANTRSAKKGFRTSVKKRAVNDKRRRIMKESMKEVRDLVRTGNVAEAEAKLPKAYKAIDKAAKRFLHKNTASRYKSRLSQFIRKQKTQ